MFPIFPSFMLLVSYDGLRVHAIEIALSVERTDNLHFEIKRFLKCHFFIFALDFLNGSISLLVDETYENLRTLLEAFNDISMIYVIER